MKKLTAILLTLTLIFSFTACGETPPTNAGTETDADDTQNIVMGMEPVTEYYEDGTVSRTVEIENDLAVLTVYRENGSLASVTKFDKYENVVYSAYYNDDGELASEISSVYEYDKNRNIISQKLYNGVELTEDNLATTTINEYDKNNNLIHSESIFKTTGGEISTEEYNAKYDKNNNLTYSEKIKTYASGDVETNTQTFEYDNNNKLAKHEDCTKYNGDIYETIVYYYKNGFTSRRETYDKNNNLIEFEDFEVASESAENEQTENVNQNLGETTDNDSLYINENKKEDSYYTVENEKLHLEFEDGKEFIIYNDNRFVITEGTPNGNTPVDIALGEGSVDFKDDGRIVFVYDTEMKDGGVFMALIPENTEIGLYLYPTNTGDVLVAPHDILVEYIG